MQKDSNTHSNCFDIVFSLIQEGGVATTPGSRLLIGRVSSGEFSGWLPCSLVGSDGRTFPTRIVMVRQSGTQQSTVAKPGSLYKVLITGIFPPLPPDCQTATLAVLTAEDVSTTWQLSRSGDAAILSPTSRHGLAARTRENIVLCTHSLGGQWATIVTENRLLYVRLRPASGDVCATSSLGGLPAYWAQEDKLIEKHYKPLLERIKHLIQAGQWQELYAQFPVQDLAGKDTPTRIVYVGSGGLHLSIPGYGTLYQNQCVFWSDDFHRELAELSYKWSGEKLDYRKGKWWKSNSKGWFAPADENAFITRIDSLSSNAPKCCLVRNARVESNKTKQQLICKKCGHSEFDYDGVWYSCKTCGNKIYV